ncbi:hypothetical protein [Sphaerisporangium fuscum]|nr:hypothetical protein [Sphaerisporangium fuscum]
MATRIVAAMGSGGFGWVLIALGAAALAAVSKGAIPVPSGISWT